VAFDSNYGIGKDGRLPWNLPSDLKHFKEITSIVNNPSQKNAVIMGRKTWESLPIRFRPLPGRVNLVLSKQEQFNLPAGVLASANLTDALTQLTTNDIENIFVIGGAQVYAEAIEHPSCDKIYVTHVKGDFHCDAFFPPLSRQFIPISATEELHQEGISFHFSEYLRS